MGGIEYHPNNWWELYSYAGDVYAGRFAYVLPTGTAAGYGSRLVNYAGFWASEVAMNSKTKGTFRPQSNSLILLAALFASILAFTRILAAQSHGPQYSQEQVKVVGHLDLQGMPVKQILQQQRVRKGIYFFAGRIRMLLRLWTSQTPPSRSCSTETPSPNLLAETPVCLHQDLHWR
jgi:hypothetical protein